LEQLEQFFDIRTLFFVLGAVSLVLCLGMINESIAHKTYNGFDKWTAGTILMSAGSIFIGLRGYVPETLSVVLANALFIAYFTFVLRGLAEFFSKKVAGSIDIAAWVVFICTFIYFTYLAPDINARIVIMSVLISLYCFRIVLLLNFGKSQPDSGNHRLLFFAIALLGTWYFCNSVVSLMENTRITDFMQAGAFHGASLVVLVCCSVLITIGLIQANSGRLEQELLESQTEINTLSGLLPICCSCKKIRDDQGFWNRVETYISKRTDAKFTHGLCPECRKKLYPNISDK
jgi:hypothetical protein